MPLFSKTKVVIWPKNQSVEVYLDQKENNTFSFDLNLWNKCSDTELQSLATFLSQKKITLCSVLIPDDIVFTKAFIYDTKITQIDKKEVIGLAQSFVKFTINEDSLNYNLVQDDQKTIIQSTIFDKEKLDNLKENLSKLNIKIEELQPVSSSISKVINSFFNKEFFLVYPLSSTEYTLLLSKGDSVYLTSNLKGNSLEVQKIINYSNLYFTDKITKFFLPENNDIEIISTTKLDQTKFNESQIATEFKKPSNFPLPILGLMLTSVPKNSGIISPVIADTNLNKTMENKKSFLPIIAVFIITAAVVSMIIWFVVNRGNSSKNNSPEANITPTIEITPTEIPSPTPTVAEISKTIKLQVLNGTDINGQAATVKNELTALGFTSVAVGNSKTKATQNTVQLKASLSSASAYFQSKLDGKFPATYTTDLKETSTYDAIFTIGTNLSTGASASSEETSEVTPTATKSATITPTKALSPTKALTPTPTP